MVRYKTVVRMLFAYVVFTTVCALSTQAQAFSITFDFLGSEGVAVDGLTAGPVTVGGLTATFICQQRYFKPNLWKFRH